MRAHTHKLPEPTKSHSPHIRHSSVYSVNVTPLTMLVLVAQDL